MVDVGMQDFRDRFPSIAALVDGTGEHRLELTHSLADAAGDTTVIIKRQSNSRGWGMTWRGDELIGMRGLRYVADASDASPSNAEFLGEFRRRLSILGASLHCVEGGAGYAQCAFDAAARSSKFKGYRPPRPYPEVQAQLREYAF